MWVEAPPPLGVAESSEKTGVIWNIFSFHDIDGFYFGLPYNSFEIYEKKLIIANRVGILNANSNSVYPKVYPEMNKMLSSLSFYRCFHLLKTHCDTSRPFTKIFER